MGIIIIPGQDDPPPEPGHQTVPLSMEDLDELVREAIAANRKVRRSTLSQELLDRAVERLYEEGELLMAAGVLQLIAARVAGYHHPAVEALMQIGVDVQQMGLVEHRCRVCGCTDDAACPGGCYWVEIDLCSACSGRINRASADAAFGPGPGRDS